VEEGASEVAVPSAAVLAMVLAAAAAVLAVVLAAAALPSSQSP
jgi:hypothetical protein